jgi:hypothetical protein
MMAQAAISSSHLGEIGLDPMLAALHHMTRRTPAAAAAPSVIDGPEVDFTRACRQLSQIVPAARWMAARKFLAVLS